MKRNIISQIAMVALLATIGIVSFTSCDAIYDDLDPCPETPPTQQGAKLRFVYDYNMEYANAFPSKVDCLTLYVYDGDGNYVSTITETSSVLSDEDYRMELDLPVGDYHFVAYGGIACADASFRTVSEPTSGSLLSSLETTLIHDGNTSDKELHGFYFGDLDMAIHAESTDYTEGTVEMMKNTNNVQVILQQISGEPVYAQDFEFSIIDDNTLFSYDNSLIADGETTYLPWAEGERTTGTRAEGDEEEDVVVAYAEMSTSRLWTGNSPRLVVTNRETRETTIDIPLNNYLLLVKSDHYSSMGSQEFLDRQSEWTMMFFLDEGDNWLRTYIVVNDWVVRINDSSF